MILRLAGGKLIRWVNFLKAKRQKAPPARKNRGLKQKYSKKRVFESAAGEPKNEVFWAKSRVEPPPGGGGVPLRSYAYKQNHRFSRRYKPYDVLL